MVRKHLYILFISSLLANAIIILTLNKDFISNDGISYQKYGINIANGNGYSADTTEPYTKYHFREPGYPALMSLAGIINKHVLGNRNTYLGQNTYNTNKFIPKENYEIPILKSIQGLISAFSIIVFYLIINSFLKPNPSFIISLILIFYLPYSIQITFISREILLTLVLLIINLIVIKNAKKNINISGVIIAGTLLGITCLTLQAYYLTLPFFFISFYYLSRNFLKSLYFTSMISVIALIIVLPWIIRSYNEYPDLRVAKSLGTSYTYELKGFLDATYKASKLNMDPEGVRLQDNMWKEYKKSSSVIFERSFNGYYNKYADSLNNVINTKVLNSNQKRISFFLNDIFKNNIRKCLIWPLWKSDYSKTISAMLDEGKSVSMLISLLIGVIVFILFLIGVFSFFKHTIWFLPVFVFHLLMIPLMGDEARRVLPYLPFYLMYSILGIIKVINLFKRNEISVLSL